ncbi:MAG: ABC transporter permease [Christensenella sp.]|nr:ABC transporter permease [Christensenella sp.]
MKGKLSVGEFFKKFGIVIVLIALFTVFALLNPYFLDPSNIMELLKQVAFMGIIAVGMTFCMLTGGIDLSVGSNMALAVVVAALVMAAVPFGTQEANAIVGSLVGIGAATLVGFANGFFVNEIKIPPLIVTLAMMQIVRGIVYISTGAIPIYENIPEVFSFLGQGSIGPVPFPVIVMAITFVIGGIILHKTVYGRHVYCVGGNEEVARLSGIGVKKVKYSVYMISGLLTGIAGILLLSRMNSGQPRAGLGYEFEVVTACVLGGISMAGGSGKLWGVFFGVVIMGTLSYGLVSVGLNEFWQMMIKGVVLLIAVGIDSMSQAKKHNLVEIRREEEERKKEAAA